MFEYLNLSHYFFLFYPTEFFLLLPVKHIYCSILQSQLHFLYNPYPVLMCKTPEIMKL